MRETREKLDAFEYYVTLMDNGYNKSKAMKAIGKKYDRYFRTIWKWCSEFDWENRYYKRMMKVQKQIEAKRVRDLADNKILYLSQVHKLLNDFVEEGKEKGKLPVKIKTVRDLEILIKLALVLQESPTDYQQRNNINIDVESEELFDKELMKQILEEEEDLTNELQKEIYE